MTAKWLLAEHDGTMLGVARYFANPDRLRAEYAVAVRSDWKRRGIGYVLMTRLIDAACQAGIGELVGNVLHENPPMLDMYRELGFTVTAHPNDATGLTVRKSLVQAVRHLLKSRGSRKDGVFSPDIK
jgi:acetyltransferase